MNPTTTKAKSPLTNAWGKVEPIKVAVEHLPVYLGREGAAYSHQAQLTSHEGILYATWTSGIRDEEGPGERMVLAASRDLGETWSEPITVAPSNPGRFGPSVVVSSGLRIHNGRFIAYYGEWERSAEGLNPDGSRNEVNSGENLLDARTEARTSDDQGRTWSAPIPILPRLVNYMPPAPLQNGRLIFPGNLTHGYTDDPAGLVNWQRAVVAGLPSDYTDNYYNTWKGGQLIGTEYRYSEASFFQTDDQVIYMMLRNENKQQLGVTESHDNGKTWSHPIQTDFSDVVARSHFGRLPDGRFFGLNCPQPHSATSKQGNHTVAVRTPAVLAVSHDGIRFDRHFVLGSEPEGNPRIPGLYKHGQYGYPYLHTMGEHGFMIYSRNKEDIYVGRFSLSDIA